MNPTTVRNQGLVYLVLGVATPLGGTHGLAVACAAFASLSFFLFIVLNVAYARRLAGTERTDTRHRGDRIVGWTAALTAAVTTAAAAVAIMKPGIRGDYLRDIDLPLVMTGCVVFAAATTFTSSLVDWYYVRPWRDGTLQVPPPCHGQNPDGRKMLTRIWFYHRSAAAIAVALGLVSTLVGLVDLATNLLPDSEYNKLFLQTVGVPVTLLTVPMLPWFRGLITILPNLGSNFRATVGDVISANVGSEVCVGRIYEVSLDHGFTVVGDDGESIDIKLHESSLTRELDSALQRRCGQVCQSYDTKRSCEYGDTRILPNGTSVAQRSRSYRSNRLFVL